MVGGQVAEALVEEGAQVVAGQPLVVFKNANLQLQTMSQEAQTTQQLFQLTSLNQSLEEQHLQRASQLAEADYQVRTLTAELERKRPLLARGFASRAEIEGLERSLAREQRKYVNLQAAAQADDAARPEKLAQVRKSIDLITGNLAMTRENLDALTLRAPISGQLTMLDAETGAAKSAGARIGQIDSADGFKVRAAGSEYYFARVMTGQKATAEIDDRTYGLHVTKVYPGVKNQEFAVDLTFDASHPPFTVARPFSSSWKSAHPAPVSWFATGLGMTMRADNGRSRFRRAPARPNADRCGWGDAIPTISRC